MSFKSFAKGFGKFATNLGDMASDGINKFVDGRYAGKAFSAFYDKIVRPIGKATGNTTLKVGASGLKGTADAVDYIRNNKDNIKDTGKSIFNFFKKGAGDVAKEGNEFVNAAFGFAELLERAHIIESTKGDLGKSLIGYKFTKGAKMGMIPLGLAAGAIGGTKDYMTSREGRNDGRTYSITPSMANPYELSQQIAYSQMGQSFANNAGADGDLIRALSNMR